MEFDSLLDKIAKEEDIYDYTVSKFADSEKGDGYMGIISYVEITGKDKNSEKPKVLNLIQKTATKSDALRKQAPVPIIFIREIYMYQTIFDNFRELERQKGLPLSYFAPKFYGGNLTDKNEVLLLENLKTSGYRLFERRIPMDENHVSLVCKEYARFHALSLALHDQNPKEFAKSLGSMDDVFINFLVESDFKGTLIQRCAKSKQLLNSEFSTAAITTYDNFVNSIDSFLMSLPESVDKYSVALHGDCWTNNILFKYKDNDASVPDQMRFIDFQVSRLGSPVLDLSYFFYACSSKKIVDKFSDYKQLYYNSLASHLQRLGSDSDKVFPYSVFEDHWKKYAKFGLICAMFVIHFMLSEKDEAVDLSEVTESGTHIGNAFNYEIANSAEYDDRVRHLILHFIENNLF